MVFKRQYESAMLDRQIMVVKRQYQSATVDRQISVFKEVIWVVEWWKTNKGDQVWKLRWQQAER